MENDNDLTIDPEDEEKDGFGRSGKEKKLKEELKECQKERAEYLDGWQRAKADLVNARREFEERRKDLVTYANENLILELLLVLDSFDMAFSNKNAWNKVDENWRRGVEHIHSQLETVLRSNGIEAIEESEGKFSAERHESVGTVPTKNKDDDEMIAELVQRGYMLRGKVIRPAKVKLYEAD